jgi:hypothetical protein
LSLDPLNLLVAILVAGVLQRKVNEVKNPWLYSSGVAPEIKNCRQSTFQAVVTGKK